MKKVITHFAMASFMALMAQGALADSNHEMAKVVCGIDIEIERPIVDAAWNKEPISYPQAQAYLDKQLEVVKKKDNNGMISNLVSQVATNGVKVTFSPKYFTAGVSKAFGNEGIYTGMTDLEIKLFSPMTLQQFKEYYLESAYGACMLNVESALNKANQ